MWKKVVLVQFVCLISLNCNLSLAENHSMSIAESRPVTLACSGKQKELRGKIDSGSPIILDFMGKSIAGARDVGVIAAIHEALPNLKPEQTIFAGNSSGALLAAYFSCWGISNSSIARAKGIMTEFDYSLISSDWGAKLKKLMVGAPTEFPHENILPLIDQLLTKDGQTCNPDKELLIPAVNLDVIDNRIMVERRGNLIPKLLEVGKKKTIETDQFDVTMDGKHIGKACTYFVTRPTYEKLKKLSYADRLCDLRLIENAEDLKIAILASVSEPTYFPPVEETQPEKIQHSKITDLSRRSYLGGYLNQTLAEDLKKVNSDSYSLATGIEPFSEKSNSLLERWFLFSTNASLERGRKTIDLEIPASGIWDRFDKLTPVEWYNEGYAEGKKSLCH